MNDELHGITAQNLRRSFPVALRNDSVSAALASVAAEILAAQPEEIDLLRIYPEIERLPESLLDILAYDFKIDWWDGEFSLTEKRETLQNSWRVHRHLGTRHAVETAAGAVFPTAIEEWYEYGGKPHFFRVLVNLTNVSSQLEQLRKMWKLITIAKRLSSWIEDFHFTVELPPACLHMGGSATMTVRLPVMEQPDSLHLQGKTQIGGTTAMQIRLPIPSQQ